MLHRMAKPESRTEAALYELCVTYGYCIGATATGPVIASKNDVRVGSRSRGRRASPAARSPRRSAGRCGEEGEEQAPLARDLSERSAGWAGRAPRRAASPNQGRRFSLGLPLCGKTMKLRLFILASLAAA